MYSIEIICVEFNIATRNFQDKSYINISFRTYGANKGMIMGFSIVVNAMTNK